MREAVITGETEYPGTFEITNKQATLYRKMLSDWQYKVIADRKLLKQDDQEDEQEAVYNYYMLAAFAIGLQHNREYGIENASPELIEYLQTITIPPDYNNKYLQGVIRDGMKRVKTKLAKDYRDGVLSWKDY